MELTDLRYFHRVATSASFVRAARLSHVSPPAISKSIRKLEEELGERLLARTSRRVALTPAGEVLLRRAERVLAEVDELRHDLDAVSGTVRGDVRIGAMEVFSLEVLPAAIARVVRAHPGVLPRSHEMAPERMEELLAAGKLDVGFTIGGGGERAVEYRVLGKSPGLLVCGKRHPLFRAGRVTRAALHEHTFVVPQFLGLEHAPPLDQFPEDRWPRRVGATIELLQMAIELVASGVFLGFFPEMSVRSHVASGRLRVLTGLGATAPFELRALLRSGVPPRPAVRVLLDEVSRSLRAR